jgi:hypothetical protein
MITIATPDTTTHAENNDYATDSEGAQLRQTAELLDTRQPQEGVDASNGKNKTQNPPAEDGDTRIEQAGNSETASKETPEADATKAGDENFWKEWLGHYHEAARENPELNQAGSSLQKQVMANLRSPDPEIRAFLAQSPRGVRYAVQLAKLQNQAARYSHLEKENAQLRAALRERDKKLSPGGGVAATPPATKTFDQMTFEEQGAFLKRMAQEEDGLI